MGKDSAEVKEPSNQFENPDIKVMSEVATGILNIVNHLQSSPSIKKYIQGVHLLKRLRGFIRKVEEKNLTIKNLTIMKLLRSIAENRKLLQVMSRLKDGIKGPNCIPGSVNNEEFYRKLDKLIEDFQLLNLACKIEFLLGMKEQKCFTNIRKTFNNWNFYGLINNEDFKQEFIEKAIDEEGEPFKKNFREDVNEYIRLVQLGKGVMNQYFKDEGANVKVYYEARDRILHTNFINYYGTEPIRTSDILQHKKDIKNIKELHIYHNKELEVQVSKKGRGRNYKFEKGANYKMTSIWPAKDEHGKCCNCKMVMHIDSNGITKIVEFAVNNNKLNSSSEGFLKLVEQNKELYIKHQSLEEAVKKFLGLQQNSEHEKVLNKEEITPVPKVENKEYSRNTESSTASDPSKDLVAIRKKLRELNIELANLEKKVKRAKYVINENVCLAGDLKSQIAWVENLIRINQEIDSRYDESKDIRRKLGDLRQFVCEVKERSKGPEWDKGNVSSLGTLCILTDHLYQGVNKAYFSIEVLQQKFRANLLSSDVEKFIKQHSKLINGVEYIDSIKHDGNAKLLHPSTSQHVEQVKQVASVG